MGIEIEKKFLVKIIDIDFYKKKIRKMLNYFIKDIFLLNQK